MKKELIGAFVWAVLMLGLAFGATLAHRQGYIGHDTVVRLTTGVIGLWMAWYGNQLPKRFVKNAQARQAQRVSAWSQVISGLGWAGLWAFAPIPVAMRVGVLVIVAGIAVTLGYCLTQRSKAKAA